jgi:hypothetical protein
MIRKQRAPALPAIPARPLTSTTTETSTTTMTPATTDGGDAWILLGQDRPGVTVSLGLPR